MYELVQVSPSGYYIQSPAKVGLIRLDGNRVCLIDSGSDRDAGKKIKRILDANGWTLEAVYNTHAHADHIGGNQYLQSHTGCRIYALGIEACFAAHPLLEPACLFGGNPPGDLRHKFLMAQPSRVLPLTDEALPEGVEAIPLPGHSFDMAGFRTAEGIVYLADCLSSRETLEKYRITFLVDPGRYLETLEGVKRMEAFETILKTLFDGYGLKMTFEQHALVGSTVRSYLAWLKDTGRLQADFAGNALRWRAV